MTQFNSPEQTPTEDGWYLCKATDNRWNGENRYRAYGNEAWWIPLLDGWLESSGDAYEWHGPVADVNGPAPDGTDPRT